MAAGRELRIHPPARRLFHLLRRETYRARRRNWAAMCCRTSIAPESALVIGSPPCTNSFHWGLFSLSSPVCLRDRRFGNGGDERRNWQALFDRRPDIVRDHDAGRFRKARPMVVKSTLVMPLHGSRLVAIQGDMAHLNIERSAGLVDSSSRPRTGRSSRILLLDYGRHWRFSQGPCLQAGRGWKA